VEIQTIIDKMRRVGLNITAEGTIEDFLGVKITRTTESTFELTQPHLVQQILQDLHLDQENVNAKDIPALSSKLLRRHSEADTVELPFNYRSVIGKLNYLEKSTRPDIAFATHQCARFSDEPKREHIKAITHIARYLAGTKANGMVYKPTSDLSFDCYVDADFAGNWNKEEAALDADTARSRSGYVITFAGCPILWASKLQTHIALSTTEAEYMALSAALRDVIPLMELAKEMQQRGFLITSTVPRIHCKVFEDNSGAIEIATTHKYRPRTKHINTQYHHFRHYVDNGEITIHAIDTKDQAADMLTKPLNQAPLHKHRQFIMGW